MPINVSEKQTLMPVKISGTAAGNKIVRTITGGLNFMTWPVLIKIGLIVRTALSVNSATGMMPWIAPNAIFADRPRPKNRRMIG